jgi:preprotein translocase subunit SecE
MNELNNTNLILRGKKIFKEVLMEARLLTTPSIKDTYHKIILIIIICGILSLYFLLIGEITVSLIRLFGV